MTPVILENSSRGTQLGQVVEHTTLALGGHEFKPYIGCGAYFKKTK